MLCWLLLLVCCRIPHTNKHPKNTRKSFLYSFIYEQNTLHTDTHTHTHTSSTSTPMNFSAKHTHTWFFSQATKIKCNTQWTIIFYKWNTFSFICLISSQLLCRIVSFLTCAFVMTILIRIHSSSFTANKNDCHSKKDVLVQELSYFKHVQFFLKCSCFYRLLCILNLENFHRSHSKYICKNFIKYVENLLQFESNDSE